MYKRSITPGRHNNGGSWSTAGTTPLPKPTVVVDLAFFSAQALAHASDRNGRAPSTVNGSEAADESRPIRLLITVRAGYAPTRTILPDSMDDDQ